MKSVKFLKNKRAISPVVATILLISLVVAAGSMVYFLVVPMLRGSANLQVLNAQWFDSDGDYVADTVYITIINSGTAQAIIEDIIITIDTPTQNETAITNAQLVDQSYPIEMDISFQSEIVITFDPSTYVELGNNVFRIKVVYNQDNFIYAPESMKYSIELEPLSLEVLNPVNGTWYSGSIDPQAIRSGGYQASVIKYNFSAPDGTPLLTNVTYTENIDSTAYSDGQNYMLTLYVSDYFGTLVSKTVYINIDNTNPAVSLTLNGSTFNQGEGVDISWTVTGIDPTAGDSPLINQTLTLTGTTYSGRTLYTDDGSTAQEGVAQSPYDLPGSETLQMKEDTYTVTIYVKDSAGNTMSSGQDFFLQDLIVPDTHFISPENDSGIKGTLAIEIYADDITGIDENRLSIKFYDTTTGALVASYSQQGTVDYNGTAVYDSNTKKWVLTLPSYILPNGQLYVLARVYDSSTNINYNDSSIYINVANVFLEGVTARADEQSFLWWSWWELTFFLKNNYISDFNFLTVKVIWDTGPSGYEELYCATTDTDWLKDKGGTYANNTEYDVEAGSIITSGSTYELQIIFPDGQDIRGAQFRIYFTVNEMTLNEYILITVASNGATTIQTIST